MSFLGALRHIVDRFVPVDDLDREALRVLRRGVTLWSGAPEATP